MIILILGFVLGCGLIDMHHEINQKSEVVGTVVDMNVTQESYKRPAKRIIKYSFAVDGKEYIQTTGWEIKSQSKYRERFSYFNGMRGKVCYEAKDPNYSSFYHNDQNFKCGSR